MLIGLAGKKNAGKDTAADYLVESYGFSKLAFGDMLKDSLCASLSITRNQFEELKNNPDARVVVTKGKDVYGIDHVIRDLSVREFIQLYATEAHRDIFWRAFWVDMLLPSEVGVNLPVKRGFDTDGKYVICDCRFNNEANAVKELDGIVIRISRNLVDMKIDPHSSEVGIDPHYIDFVVENDDSISMLYTRLDTLMETLLAEAPVPK
jgi:deoxynucleotide monophosphate kinase-like protein